MLRIIFLFILFSSNSYSNDLGYDPGTIIVKYKNNIGYLNKKDLEKQVNIEQTVYTFSSVKNLELVRLKKGEPVEKAIQKLRDNPQIAYAEPDFILHTLDTTPNDPYWNQLWDLRNINMQGAWDITQGSPSISVGVIDTGVDYNHPDLSANIDRANARNMINNTNDPMDDDGHGTHVSGTIAALGNNRLGIAGMAWKTKIIPCKFLDGNGDGKLSDAIKCLDYFASLATRKSNPIHLVATNNSYGGGGFSQAFFEALQAQQKAGILFIAAAGNSKPGKNNDISVSYPANYPLPNVISVAALNKNGTLAEFSHYGANSVHIAAPGVDIFSTLPGGKYGLMSGTSMAAPHVAGLAALISAAYPNLRYFEIKNLIMNSGLTNHYTESTTISGKQLSASSDNGYGALSCTNKYTSKLLEPKARNVTLRPGDKLTISFLSTNCEKPAYPNELQAHLSDDTHVSLYDDGKLGDAIAGDGIYTGVYTLEKTGNYQLTFPDQTSLYIQSIDQKSNYHFSQISSDYISINGNPLPLGDETIATLSSPFPIHLGDNNANYDTLNISSDGTISLTDRYVNFKNQPLPIREIRTLIAPYWDSFYIKNASSELQPRLSWAVTGISPNRMLIIEWKDIPLYDVYPSRDNGATFQVVFFENSSDIKFNYKDTYFGDSTHDDGKTATVGVQIAPDIAAQYSFDRAMLYDKVSLLFSLH